MIGNMNIRTIETIRKYKKIVLWGAGFACEDTVKLFGSSNIVAIFDNDEKKWGMTVGGVRVKSPKEIKQFVTNETAVVISTNGYEYEIASELTNRGISRQQLFCNSNKITEKWRYRPDIINASVDKIEKVYSMLEDEESKEYYLNFINACLTRDPFYFKDNPRCTRPFHYDTDIVNIGVKEGDVIIDCGAFDGDTARIFRKMTNNNCQVYCFEPVDENYNKMVKWINEEAITGVFPIHAGVGKERHTDYVYSTEKMTTKGAVGENRFNAENPVVSEILVETIDEKINNTKIDYIKMDIEGAEMDALHGAKNTILKYQPQMLISAYHKISDMWNVPEFIFGLHDDYKVFLGHQPHAPYEPEFLFCRGK